MKRCSFCGIEENRITPVIEGAEATICESCAEASVEMLRSEKKVKKTGLLRPYELKSELDKYVIGQDEAKKALAVAAYNHYKRIDSGDRIVEINKSNVLMWGPSGSGKTYLIQTLAGLLDVPFVIGDATTLTKAGYIGDDVETVIQRLLERADGNVEKAEKGIVYIDEIDKVAKDVGDRDPGGRAVQEGLLKLMEDRDVVISGGPTGKNSTVNTKDILFIFGGAFVSLENDKKGSRIGFLGAESQDDATEKEITHEDFITYGLIPEFVGRIPVITRLSGLKKENLVEILTKPKNAVIKQYQALFKMDGIQLTFDEDAVDYIAEQAMKKKTGARGLKGIIEKQIMQLMFELPGKSDSAQVTITASMLKGDPIVSQSEGNGETTENLTKAG